MPPQHVSPCGLLKVMFPSIKPLGVAYSPHVLLSSHEIAHPQTVCVCVNPAMGRSPALQTHASSLLTRIVVILRLFRPFPHGPF